MKPHEFLVLSVLLPLINATQVLRPRGVPLSRKVFYDPRKDFTCLDGSGTFSFQLVNDDYCDCNDGSDEPGTSACPGMIFNCPNVGYFEKNIPTSRVNDGICDCCDGSDEYNTSKCADNCVELGQQAREELKRLHELHEQGSQIRSVYIEEATKKLNEERLELENVRKRVSEIEAVKHEKEELKKQAEEKEKEVLDRVKKEKDAIEEAKKELEMQKAQEEERKVAESAFNTLDLDHNNLVTFQEVQSFDRFDQNSDGQVSEDEAKFFLHMKPEMDLEEFVTTGWVIMKPYYTRTTPQEHATNDEHEVVTESSHPDPFDQDEQHDEVDPAGLPDDADEDDEEDEGKPYFPPKEDFERTPPSQVEPEYDEESKLIIENAKKAREEYSEAENSFVDLNRRLRELEVALETDYGHEGAFKALHGQCFEMTDREYTYKLCPFDRASQRPKDGGSETSLGRWGKWSGNPDLYSKMTYEGGATCWNGPARSVTVSLRCGLINQLLSASEPSRCEYAFDFETPALCTPMEQLPHHEHTEL